MPILRKIENQLSGVDVGFTGTQSPITTRQRTTLAKLIAIVKSLHHGDCVNADQTAHDIAITNKKPVYIHPPENDNRRAFCKGAVKVFTPKPYLERNHNIVDATEILLACPKTAKEVIRSGTWATIRYAAKAGKPVLVINPEGTVKLFKKEGEDD